MSSQRDEMTTKQALEQYTEGKNSPWTLENPTTTSKTES